MTRAPLFAALTLLLALASGCTSSEPQPEDTQSEYGTHSQALFENNGFEEGSLRGWTVDSRKNTPVGFAIKPDGGLPTSVEDLQLAAGTESGKAYTKAVRATGGPESAMPKGLETAPAQGVSLRWPKYGNWAGVVNEEVRGFNVNILSQKSTVTPADVDPADGKVHIRFVLAPVFEAPYGANHTMKDQPYVFAILRNVTQGREKTLWSMFNYARQPGVPWKTYARVNNDPIEYTDWRSVDVVPGDEKLSIGDTVELQVYASVCSYGYHFAEVYVDSFGAFLPGIFITAYAPQWANAGDDLTYTYVVKNGGNTAVDDTTVTINLPDKVTFDSLDTPPGVTCTPNSTRRTVTCDLGTTNSTASTTFRMKVKIDSNATGKVSHGDYSVSGNNVSPIIGHLVETNLTKGATYADLSATLTDDVVAVGWDRPVTYTLTVTNNGPNPVSGATIKNALPAELTGGTWTCVGASGATCAAGSGSGNIDTTANIPVGGQVTFTVKARVIAGTGTGSVRNVATVATPAGIQDSDDTNNVAVDVDSIGTLYVLTARKNPQGNGEGTIISSPTAIRCEPGCTSEDADFSAGAAVSLTATAAPGSVFVGWSDACSGTVNPCNLTLNAATTVTARFDLRTYPITTHVTGTGGTLTCPASVAHGQTLTCTITPDPGYALLSLTDNGTNVTASVSGGTYTQTGIVEPHDLVAVFTKTTTCSANSECTTGFCVDGVCCNTACDGQCEACNVAGSVGTCSAVTGAPQGNRPACGADGSECGGTCDGTNRAACSYPSTTTECGTASCSNGVATPRGICDGAGACTSRPEQSCGNYACGEVACFAECTTNDQCARNNTCEQGQCKPTGDHSQWIVEGSGCSSTGSANAWWPLMLGSIALFLRRRRTQGAALAAVAAVSVPVAAQAQQDLDRTFLVERFLVQPGRNDILGVQSASVPEHLTLTARLFASYANRPLRLTSSLDGDFQHLLVKQQTAATLAASLSLFDWLEVGAAIPVVLRQTAQPAGMVDPRLEEAVPTSALSDIRLSLKAALLESEDFGLAVALPIAFPTAPRDAWVGESGFTFNPSVLGEWRGPRGSALLANAGVLLGRSRQFLNLHLGTAVSYGIGGKVDLVPRWKLALLSTLNGEVGLSRFSTQTNPLELLLALRWGFIRNMELTLGGGPGLTQGFGTPRYRLFAGLSFVPSSSPRPVEKPTPPPPAPLVARDDEGKVLAGETLTLEVLKNDEGLPGESLRVSEVATASGGRVELTPEGTLRYTANKDFSGRDTFTYNVAGNPDRSATATVVVNVEALPPPPPPKPTPPPVVVEKNQIRTLEKVYFDSDKDNVLPESERILDSVAEALANNPGVKKVRIEAHTDNEGDARYNKALSERRASWVREYLIRKGIDAKRLESAGFGVTKPIDTNDTAEGRANNRRVEFVIVQ